MRQDLQAVIGRLFQYIGESPMAPVAIGIGTIAHLVPEEFRIGIEQACIADLALLQHPCIGIVKRENVDSLAENAFEQPGLHGQHVL